VTYVATEKLRTVLVVDDSALYRQMISDLLSDAGFDIREAVDGVEAFDAILKEKYPLIVSDWAMPRMNGVELIRNLRTSALSWYPYVVLLTAMDNRAIGMESGADDYLSKPIDGEMLVQRLRVGHRIICLHETLRENNDRLNDANEKLTELAVKDSLSGLLNRRAFFEHTEKEWRRSVRYDLPISCLMLDIDHFKRINDTYGHPAGDSVIRKISQIIREVFRDTDIMGRYGGEEFSVVLYDCDTDAAAVVAERLRKAIESVRMPEIAEDFRFTTSCGLASRTLDMLSEESLVEHADQALLFAKRSGRNRVTRFDELKQASNLLDGKPPEIENDDTSRASDDAVIPYQVVNTLLAALRHRDSPTVEHSRRVAQLCREFSQHLGLPPEQRVSLEVAALLHDIGRLAVPDEILKKTGELTETEFLIARQHHQFTLDILKSCFSNRSMINTVSLSRMWFDGSQGDPAGESIPLGARILAMCSFYDDVVQGRGWWDSHDEQAAMGVLRESSGTRFEPRLVEELAKLVSNSKQSAPNLEGVC